MFTLAKKIPPAENTELSTGIHVTLRLENVHNFVQNRYFVIHGIKLLLQLMLLEDGYDGTDMLLQDMVAEEATRTNEMRRFKYFIAYQIIQQNLMS